MIIIYTFYFLFHQRKKYKTRVQQVIAKNETSAIHIMNCYHSEKWKMIFTQFEFENYIMKNGCHDITPLPPLYEKKTGE